MISNQIIQNSLEEVQAISRINFCLLNEAGRLIASTFEEGEPPGNMAGMFLASGAESQTIQGYQFFRVFEQEKTGYVLAARGGGEDVYTIGKLAARQLQALDVAYKRKFDTDYYMQNLLLGNLRSEELQTLIQDLHMDRAARRAVFLIETRKPRDMEAFRLVRALFADSLSSFAAFSDDCEIVLLKELNEDESWDELSRVAFMLVDMLNAEAMIRVRVSYGGIANTLEDVPGSFREARTALEVGRIFYAERKVLSCSELGLGGLIYQIPVSLCETFLREIFPEGVEAVIDSDTMNVIHKFLNNNLNLSETARQLYVHRNTLVYRLGKLHRATGLDIRNFDDALVLRIALMVNDYLKCRRESPLG